MCVVSVKIHLKLCEAGERKRSVCVREREIGTLLVLGVVSRALPPFSWSHQYQGHFFQAWCVTDDPHLSSLALMIVCGLVSGGPFSFPSLSQRKGEWLESEKEDTGLPATEVDKQAPVEHQPPFRGRTTWRIG